MKQVYLQKRKPSLHVNIVNTNQRAYRLAICIAALSCGGAFAQTNSPPVDSSASTNVTALPDVTVVGHMDEARNKIDTDVGATKYTIDTAQLAAQAQGENASFNQVLLRAPGVSQDSYGQVHVRNEHAFVQYRINDVILPEGISVFGQELDTRFISSVSLLDGALPAEYGFRNAGVVDIHTKSGAFNQGGDVGVYGGSYDTLRPSFEYGGRDGNLNYYATGSYLTTGLGIENPTSSSKPIHDYSQQFHGFGYLSYLLNDTSRLSFMLSGAHNRFQLPDNPGQPFFEDPNNPGNPLPVAGGTTDSANLDENQTEQNYYGVVAYQKALGPLNLQVAGFSRYSSLLFQPDPQGDIYFNGAAERVDRHILTHGAQLDASYDLNDQHTIRAGAQFSASHAVQNSTTEAYMVNPPPTTPVTIEDDNSKVGYQFGGYLQDEWKITDKWTVNYGSRLDFNRAFINESAFGPRLNTVYKPWEKTTLHAGYAYYFTPPPLEGTSQTSVAKFNGTTSEAPNPGQNDPVRSEESHYFDAGITQGILPGLQLGLDGYYKIARNQLDDGQFGEGIIITPFNYHQGILYGVELSATYKTGGFSAYGNFSYSQEKAKDIDSAQFNIDPGDLAYIKDNWIFTDHNQTFTGSAGVSYKWDDTLGYVDLLYGNGLRADGAVPNGAKLPGYATVNLGVQHDIKLGKTQLTARFDVVNVADKIYEIRDGTGVGVGAPQFGARRGFYGGLSLAF